MPDVPRVAVPRRHTNLYKHVHRDTCITEAVLFSFTRGMLLFCIVFCFICLMLVTTPQAAFMNHQFDSNCSLKRGSLKDKFQICWVSLQDPFQPGFCPPLPGSFHDVRPVTLNRSYSPSSPNFCYCAWTCPICKHLNRLFPLPRMPFLLSAEGKDCCGGDIGRNNKPTGKKESFLLLPGTFHSPLNGPVGSSRKWRKKNGSQDFQRSTTKESIKTWLWHVIFQTMLAMMVT